MYDPQYATDLLAFMGIAGITQAELCRKTGLSPQYVNDLLRSRRLPGKRAAIAVFRETGVRFESKYERTLRELLEQMTEAAERAHMGYPLPAEEWFALRDTARAVDYVEMMT